MNTNEAPEKVYICNQVFPNYVDWEGSPINTKRVDNHDIEYIRTDVFIEKACKFISDRIDIPFNVECSNGKPLADSYSKYLLARLEAVNKTIEDFKNYMKGE